jgi:hypothetical protein
MEVQDSTVVRFVSGECDGAGLHTIIHTDELNCAFPPMTLFTATEVQLGSFEFDGTQALLAQCRTEGDGAFGGGAPEPQFDTAGRCYVGRERLVQWLVDNAPEDSTNACNLLSDDPDKKRKALEYFHEAWLPEGVEATIYRVNQNLVTVQATYLKPPALGVAENPAAATVDPEGAVVELDGDHSKLIASSADLG